VHNHNHGRDDDSATAEVIELIDKKVHNLNTAKKAREERSTLATVTPIKTRRRWRGSCGG
jgi:hypothetical protein